MATARARSSRSRGRRSRNRRIGAAVATVAALTIAIALGAAVTGSGDGDQADGNRPDQVGPMGGAVIDTPGQRDGMIEVGGITVEGARIEMGRVPLMKTVNPTWTLHNTTSDPVTLGMPRATVVTGCCPGPLSLDTQLVPPGAHATLVFPLQMHPGMDGPHDFRVTVPVGPQGDPLVLGVTGDFR